MFKKNLKKAASVALAASMVFSMAACGDKQTAGNKVTDTPAPTQEEKTDDTKVTEAPEVTKEPEVQKVAPHEGSTPRTIKIGTWFDVYYDSTHTDINDNPKVTNPETAQMSLDNVKAVEQKYNVRIEFVNLTWEGIMESINNSIMAGTPDCDIYMCDLQFGVPAVLNGYAVALEDIAEADDDIFTDQIATKNLKITGMDKSYLFTGNALEQGGYPLGFNKTMLDAAGLENPQDLYDRGEWTWDKFYEYCRELTKDTDGDGNIDQYGYSGFWTTALSNVLMSNGAHIAGGKKEELSSKAAIEALEFFYQLYQVDKTARPWDELDWDINTKVYTTGTVGFWTTANWIQTQWGLSSDVGFEIGIVPWPIGPSGNKDTNSQVQVSGNWYMIPVGVERPELLLAVMEDYFNWFDGDLEYRDDTEYSENALETERNFSYLKQMGETTPWFDLWQVVPELYLMSPIMGTYEAELQTPAQVAEQFKQIVQDFLDLYMN